MWCRAVARLFNAPHQNHLLRAVVVTNLLCLMHPFRYAADRSHSLEAAAVTNLLCLMHPFRCDAAGSHLLEGAAVTNLPSLMHPFRCAADGSFFLGAAAVISLPLLMHLFRCGADREQACCCCLTFCKSSAICGKNLRSRLCSTEYLNINPFDLEYRIGNDSYQSCSGSFFLHAIPFHCIAAGSIMLQACLEGPAFTRITTNPQSLAHNPGQAQTL